MTTASAGTRTVLVTSVAGGLGRAFALGCAARGNKVAVADLDEVGAAETARLVLLAGAPASWSGRVDVASVEATDRTAAEVATFGGGRINLPVNNAAVYATQHRTPLERIDPDEFDMALGVNVKGPWLMVRACSPFLGAGSSVVNLGSATVLSGCEQWLH